MRVVLFFPAVLLFGCGDGSPRLHDACDAPNTLRCGSTADGIPTALSCHDNKWFAAGFSGENLCSASCEDVGTNTVSCDGTTYGRQVTSEGAVDCDGSTEFACDILGGGILKCIDGKWAVSMACATGKRCVSGESAPACQ